MAAPGYGEAATHSSAMRATLEFLAETPGGRKIAVLGDMREWGYLAARAHQELGRHAMELGIDALLAVGELGREFITGAAELAPERARWYPDHAAAVRAALEMLQPGDVALVKGSRAMQMETIVAALLAA